ncbi:hypothetical protein J2R99_000429 [Rhodopseudomonas julia]|uniref:SGNH/GDSL hydrolase family protein n=1 Tax=Rhodopseudomonas julia TaxID=200617 RepID=A0ABU0C254_9BRAD|nr:hypothetical protein [Rhodopseudomonas julia]MDQ0324580.1 hypothetical protein [Rhodopseudomonas julia]
MSRLAPDWSVAKLIVFGIGACMRFIFRGVLVLAIVAVSWFQFFQPLGFDELSQRLEDRFDDRPAREILLLGNSRTYANHMPRMLRQIADSADSPEKYQIRQQTPPGASLEILWNDTYAQSLLEHVWDDAIVQAESRAFSSEAQTTSFMTYGGKLLRAIKVKEGSPGLVVNWAYDPTEAYLFSEADRDYYQRQIDMGHRRLARLSGAHLIWLDDVWNEVRRQHPDIAMTRDGNHPTLAASYLYALVLYRSLSGGDIARVTFVPDGLSSETAAIMSSAVARYH